MNTLLSSTVAVVDSFADTLVRSIANLDTTRLTDEGSTRTVMIVALGLVVVAFVLIAVTLWFWRHTVPDPDALESLVFFEERVVDGTEEVSVPRRRREQHIGHRKRNSED